jgi:hypothetical protein
MYAHRPTACHSLTTVEQCTLTYLREVICSKIKQTILEALTPPSYLPYAKKHFHWTPMIYEMVNWQAYTQLISKFCSQCIQIMKLCNDLLPTAWWAHKYDTLPTKHCMDCGKVEDQDHIIQCPFEPHQMWHNSLLSKLRKAHDSDQSNHC